MLLSYEKKKNPNKEFWVRPRWAWMELKNVRPGI